MAALNGMAADMAGQEIFADYKVGQVLYAVGATVKKARTRPPSPYTEDELMDDMLNAHKFGRNPAEKEILKQVTGIGTSRTRGTIIKGHVARGNLVRRKKGKAHVITATPQAFDLLALLPDVMKSVSVSALWELALAHLEAGKVTPAQVRKKITDLVTRLVSDSFASHSAVAKNRR